LDRPTAIRVAVEALIDASEDDTATSGPDAIRKIFPTIVVVSAEGAEDVPEADVAAAVEAVLQERSA
jgi:proteasome beta subunit